MNLAFKAERSLLQKPHSGDGLGMLGEEKEGPCGKAQAQGFGEAGRVSIMDYCVGQQKEFRFHFKCNDRPLENYERKNGMT